MNRLILSNATLMAMDPDAPVLRSGAAIVIEGDRILWAGPEADLPVDGDRRPLDGRLVTPALIDCHTHIVHGGHRAEEFEARLHGVTYESLSKAGGIRSTVRATRAATLDDLVATALPRIDALLADGVGTVEIKSGYGLDLDTELRMLRAARRIGQLRPVTVVTTFLGAHATPPEFAGRPDDYLTESVLPTLRAAHAEGLVDAVDAFCEGIAFSPAQVATVFDEARRLRLPVKLHAEQLSHAGGAALAARTGALSADHLEHATEDDARAMAASGTVAVLLPGAFYALRETKVPPVAAFRQHGVPMAIATDCNPGTSPLSSLLLAMNLGWVLFQLDHIEVWRAVTVHAARALGLPDRGRIAPSLRADLAIWDIADPRELLYRMGSRPLHARIHGGQWC